MRVCQNIYRLTHSHTKKVAFASVDWHDFVVVETIDFTDVDEKMRLPPPMSLKSLENMTLAQKRAAALFAGAIPDAQKEDVEKEAVCAYYLQCKELHFTRKKINRMLWRWMKVKRLRHLRDERFEQTTFQRVA